MKTLHIEYFLGLNMFISGKGDNVIVRYSKVGNWAEDLKGTISVAIREGKQEMEYVVEVAGKRVELDISQLADLRLALNEMGRRQPNTFTKYKRVVL